MQPHPAMSGTLELATEAGDGWRVRSGHCFMHLHSSAQLGPGKLERGLLQMQVPIMSGLEPSSSWSASQGITADRAGLQVLHLKPT